MAKTNSSTHESGHAVNVANFFDLITACESLDTAYQPSRTDLGVDKLKQLYQESLTIMLSTKIDHTNFSGATNKRAALYGPLASLATRLVNALAATDASPATVADAQGFTRKIRGQRSIRLSKATSERAEEQLVNTISVSQQSYEQRTEHLEKLVEVLKQESSYQPNEAELKVASLRSLIANMRQANQQVAQAYAKWNTTRMQRNAILFDPLTGLVATAQDVKKYIKSVFGARSAQYKLVSGIVFRTTGR